MDRHSSVVRHATLSVTLVILAACGDSATTTPQPAARPQAPAGPRIGMHELHMSGGTPPGWRFTPTPGDVDAGRTMFVELGCPACHNVQGEEFSQKGTTGAGPDLSGMGKHHPPEYFAEAILNPNAVLVEGPGWIGPDGRSTMPEYPDLTLGQLADLVAFIASLKTGGMDHGPMPPGFAVGMGERPKAPESAAKTFFVQSYDVKPGKLAALEEWFRTTGSKDFLAIDGLVSIETWANATVTGPSLTTVFGFRDMAAMGSFVRAKGTNPVGATFDEFLGPHDHKAFNLNPLYRIDSLSTPRRD